MSVVDDTLEPLPLPPTRMPTLSPSVSVEPVLNSTTLPSQSSEGDDDFFFFAEEKVCTKGHPSLIESKCTSKDDCGG
eukprot:3639178-Ditylum_brightwellii.AAC.1